MADTAVGRRALHSLAAVESWAAAAADVAVAAAVAAADEGTMQVAVATARWDAFVSVRAAQRHARIVDYTFGTVVAVAVAVADAAVVAAADATVVADRQRAIDRTYSHLGIRARPMPAVRGSAIHAAASTSAPWRAAETDEGAVAAAVVVEKDVDEAENGEQEEAAEQAARVKDSRWQPQGTAVDASAREEHAMAD